jgi:hypothetical protein
LLTLVPWWSCGIGLPCPFCWSSLVITL